MNQYNINPEPHEFKKILGIKELPQMASLNKAKKFEVPLLRSPNMPSSFVSGKNLWLLKPPDLNRGRGIKLFNKLNDLENLMFEFYTSGLQDTFKKNKETPESPKPERVRPSTAQKSSNGTAKTNIKDWSGNDKLDHARSRSSYTRKVHITKVFVLQKYIEKPLLIDGRKFDIRVWALISHQQDLYFFRYSSP
jgi:tubulin---tyrosine ligase